MLSSLWFSAWAGSILTVPFMMLGFPGDESIADKCRFTNYTLRHQLCNFVAVIDTATLRHLAGAGAIAHVTAKGIPGGFVLTVQIGLEETLLQAQRGGARRFRRLDALASYVRELGLGKFEVDLAAWHPETDAL